MPSRKFWLGAVLFWVAFGAIAGVQVWISMLDHHHVVPLLISHFILVWAAWAAFTAIITLLVRRYPIVPPSVHNVLIHIASALVIATIHSLYSLLLVLAMRPYDRLNANWMNVSVLQSVLYRLPLELMIYAAVTGAMQAVEYYSRAAQLETSLTKARLHALELQLQPHFLFNTLNSVSSLVRTRKNDEAVTMIAGLSDLLRYSLDHEGSERVTLEAETDMLRRYLDIQRARFADRMTYSIDIEPAALGAAVPTLILQPLAENAVRHGIGRSASGGTVAVNAFRENGWLRVDVVNTGALAAGDPEGIGLRNTRERLRRLYGENHRFDLHQRDDEVVASVRVPWAELP